MRVKVTNVDERTVAVNVRLRFPTSDPLALDESLDAITVEPTTSSGLEIGRSDLQLYGTNLSPNAQSLTYRFTLYRILNGRSLIRVGILGNYLE